MPYDRSLVTRNAAEEYPDTFGSRCWPVTPSNSADIVDPVTGNYAKYFVAKTAGDVSVLGYENDDGDTAQVITVQAGQVVYGRVRRIMSTGTTATLTGWSD